MLLHCSEYTRRINKGRISKESRQKRTLLFVEVGRFSAAWTWTQPIQKQLNLIFSWVDCRKLFSDRAKTGKITRAPSKF